jgi:hypothetical protein
MAFQIVETDSAPGFGLGPEEVEYRVAEPRWRVRAATDGPTQPAAGWVPVIRALRAPVEIDLES